MEKAGAEFVAPKGITPETLRAGAVRADGIDQVIIDAEVVLQKLKQANVLFDAAAWEALRKVNDQVKTQGKHQPELLVIFKSVLDFFARGPRAPGPPPVK